MIYERGKHYSKVELEGLTPYLSNGDLSIRIYMDQTSYEAQLYQLWFKKEEGDRYRLNTIHNKTSQRFLPSLEVMAQAEVSFHLGQRTEP